jgi:GntR family transcriptional regulator
LTSIEESVFQPVDKESKTPYYIQIKNQIVKAIEEESIKSSHQLTNEIELTKIFDVNRLTLRNALRELDLDGYIDRRKGYGTFVSAKKKISYVSQEISFYSDQLKEIDLKTTIVVNRIEQPLDEITKKLKLSKFSKVNHIERYRTLKGEPVFYSYIYVPTKFCEKFENEDLEKYSSIRLIEEKFDIKIKRIERFLEFINYKDLEDIKKVLSLEKGEGLFYMQSYLFDKENLIIAYYQDYLRTSKNKFTFYIEKNDK